MGNLDDILKNVGEAVVPTGVELTDDDLDNVSGGFVEKNSGLVTYGYNVRCPKCGADKASDFEDGVYRNTKLNSAEYHCKKCGHQFVAFSSGGSVRTSEKNSFVHTVNAAGYNY